MNTIAKMMQEIFILCAFQAALRSHPVNELNFSDIASLEATVPNEEFSL
jgi:hypothetical protein